MELKELNDEKITIFIVDDDEEDRQFVEESLEKLEKEINIIHVESGNELIDILVRNGISSPTIILLDMRMKGEREAGIETLMRIRNHKDWRAVPIIMYTGSNSKKDILKCYQMGANSYIVKPIGTAEMNKVMRLLKEYWLGAVKLPDHNIDLEK